MLVLLPLDQPPLFKLSKLVSPKEVRSSEVRLLLLCLVNFSEELDCITVKMLLSNFLPLRDTSKSLFSNFETIFHLETNFSPPRNILPHRDMSPTGKCLQLATTWWERARCWDTDDLQHGRIITLGVQHSVSPIPSLRHGSLLSLSGTVTAVYTFWYSNQLTCFRWHCAIRHWRTLMQQ